MRRHALVALSAALVAVLPAAAARGDSGSLVANPADYVDPLIGTAARGNVFPGAVLPHGMIGWSPVASRGNATAQHLSAPGGSGTYAYDSDRIRGFSLTHLNGAACGADSAYAGVSGWIENPNPDGSWPAAFDPSAVDPGFAEGDSARYTWMAYDEVAELIRLMGGRKKAIARLDAFFHDGPAWALSGGNPGRFDPTNEPDIQTPWLYDYVGAPDRTQATVRQIASRLWTATRAGIRGNDDLGTMSAWYV